MSRAPEAEPESEPEPESESEPGSEPESEPKPDKLGRDWNLLWTASTISALGDGAFIAALPLLATGITQDPRVISGLTIAGTLPWLVFSLQAGVIADRLQGRRLLVAAQGGQLAVVTAVGVFAARPWSGMPVLYVLAFLLGTASVLANNTAQTVIPAVVPRDLLVTANSRMMTSLSLAEQFLGPAIGSSLFVIAPLLPFWADAVTFAASMLLVARLPHHPDRAPRARLTIRAEVAEGLSWLMRHRVLRTATGLVAVANFGNFMGYSTLVLFVGPKHYGLLLSATAVGGIAGSFASRRIVARFGGRRVVRITIVAAPLAMLGVGLLGPSFAVVAPLTATSSACAALWNVASLSQRQRLVPEHLRGRVASAGLMMAWGAQPLGALAGGLIARSFGLAAPWLVGGGLRLCAAMAAMRPLRDWEG